eukprot:m.234140 g.234140  ORF g.234140 m.234140 type:complete len:334 (+) comp40104_c0_seq5:805-1806(+)
MAKGQQRAQQNVEIFPDRLKQLEDQLADIAAQQAAILSAQSSRMVPTKVNRPISPSSSSSGSDSEKEAEVKSLPKTVRLSKTRSARKYSSQRNPVSQSGTESRRKKITSVDQDKRRRDQIAVKKPAHSTGSSSSPAMSELIAELDQERDRRFKAEQAARKLVEHLKSMQRKVSEEQRQQESVIVKLSQLQKILHQEKDEKVKFQEEYEKQQSHIRKMNEELLLYQEQAEECKQALRDTENAAFKLETERLQEQASQVPSLGSSCQQIEIRLCRTNGSRRLRCVVRQLNESWSLVVRASNIIKKRWKSCKLCWQLESKSTWFRWHLELILVGLR